jgi:glucokinase
MGAYIAVDVGGTQIRAAVFPEDGVEPIRQKKILTRDKDAHPETRMNDLIAELWPAQEKVVAIGVAAPGPLDPKAGVIINAPNIPNWKNFPLRNYVQERFGVPVELGNDANLAAMGEWKFGAGRGHDNLVYLTISTGIGGGVICDGHLLLGLRGFAAELGHVTLIPDGPRCSCGQPGHLEAISSGTGIANYVAEELKKGAPSCLSLDPLPTAKDINLAAQKGDSLAVAAIERAGMYLGLGLSNYLQIFNPSIIILGGSVTQCGDLLFNPMKAELKQRVMGPEYLTNLTITKAGLGDMVGLLGALALVRNLYH